MCFWACTRGLTRRRWQKSSPNAPSSLTTTSSSSASVRGRDHGVLRAISASGVDDGLLREPRRLGQLPRSASGRAQDGLAGSRGAHGGTAYVYGVYWARRKGRNQLSRQIYNSSSVAEGRLASGAGTLGFTLRTGFNLFVLLFRIRRTPRWVFALVGWCNNNDRFLDNFDIRSFDMHCSVKNASDSLQCSVSLSLCRSTNWFILSSGSFVGIYKLLINSLPLLLPPAPRHRSAVSPTSSPTSPGDIQFPVHMAPTRSERRRGRLSFRAQAREIWMQRQTRWWYSAVAGAIAGGVSISFEGRGRGMVIAQQMFVRWAASVLFCVGRLTMGDRGLQGTYNAFSTKHNVKVPNGDVLVFSLWSVRFICSSFWILTSFSCAQIMYAFLLRPDTIPPSYVAW